MKDAILCPVGTSLLMNLRRLVQTTETQAQGLDMGTLQAKSAVGVAYWWKEAWEKRENGGRPFFDPSAPEGRP